MIELIQNAVKLNYQNRPDTNIMSPERYARDFKTIHLNVGRGSGKTSAIEALARPTDLLIVHNYNTAETLRSRNFICPINTIEGVLMSANTLRGRNVKKYHWVWIDEPNLCDNVVDINKIYETVEADLFIKLGE